MIPVGDQFGSGITTPGVIVQSRRVFSAVVFFCLLLLPFTSTLVQSAETQKPERIRIGYSSISGSRISLWTAQDRVQTLSADGRPVGARSLLPHVRRNHADSSLREHRRAARIRLLHAGGAKTVQSFNFNEFVDPSFLKRVEQEGVGARR
jgi:hypothetical protein